MTRISTAIDKLTDQIGRGICWAILIMVILQFAVVVARYVYSTSMLFGVPAVWLQEGVVYLHGLTILLGTSYAMLWNKNVRVDILYSDASPRVQYLTDFFGSLLFVLPLCLLIAWGAWSNVAMSWMVKETSLEPNGLPFLYLLKAMVLVFCVLVSLQAFSTMIKALALTLSGSRKPLYEASEDLS